ncbi:MAG: esterase/lipase family protein [Gallionellaceae bacterium]|jgi:triacylglycerol esterase/lipase EstA (alpha/beta hydrolase family)
MKRSTNAVFAFAILLLSGCASQEKITRDMWYIDQGNLPAPNTTLNISGLSPCTDNPDHTLHLDANQPVAVLVHGCYGSSGLFRGLAQVLAFHGQQTACFEYNDRDKLMVASGQLTVALDQLGQAMTNKHITLIGHSQGALIARKAVAGDRPDPLSNPDLQLKLVTVSGPFDGIAAAYQCGNPVAQWLTLGLIGVTCQIATGDKWTDITSHSDFIIHPGPLHKQVNDYLKIETDEAGTCRRFKNGVCAESDDIFSLKEQSNPVIDSDPKTHIEVVNAGHVEIVGDRRVAPLKLIAILQKNGYINPTPPQRSAELKVLLSRIYELDN